MGHAPPLRLGRREKGKYRELPSNDPELDGGEDDIVEQPFGGELGRETVRRFSSIHVLTGANILVLLSSIGFFLASRNTSAGHSNAAWKEVLAYSPVLEKASLPIIETTVSGELFPQGEETDKLGRAEPGPETDKLWSDAFELQRMFAISSSEVKRLGKDPSKTIKFPPEYGLGDDAYMASLDVFHQIHCLNALRWEAFKDYYWDGEKYHEQMYTNHRAPKRVHTEFEWIHLRHCTDMILQALMCNANTEMITMTWKEEQENPWPDFNIKKKCIDFEALKAWRDENAEPLDKLHTLKKPYDQARVDDRYWELFGNATMKGDNTHHPVW